MNLNCNFYVLSNALKYFIRAGDEVIVTNQDHEANISPWRRLIESGAKIVEWQFNKNTGELEIDTLSCITTFLFKTTLGPILQFDPI